MEANKITRSALRLYDTIERSHFRDGGLIGPDPGLRFNSRIWRFAKSVLRWIPWADDRVFMQAQGYWIWCNWNLYRLLEEDRYCNNAAKTAQFVLSRQHPEGYWEYPLPQWRGRIATVEGNYGALGLLESYRHTEELSYLQGALKWYDVMMNRVGFKPYQSSLAINYFAGPSQNMIPNNTTLTLQLCAELFDITGEDRFKSKNKEMISFLKLSQKETGELPYATVPPGETGRHHFLCYQYNAFQFIDLARTWELVKHAGVHDILTGLIRFLETGQAEDGHCYYKCEKSYPEVTYYTAAMGAAFLKATEIGLGDYSSRVQSAYTNLLTRQARHGGFVHSTRNYGVLSDSRSYPRYLVMILKHLLMLMKRENESGLLRNEPENDLLT